MCTLRKRDVLSSRLAPQLPAPAKIPPFCTSILSMCCSYVWGAAAGRPGVPARRLRRLRLIYATDFPLDNWFSMFAAFVSVLQS